MSKLALPKLSAPARPANLSFDLPEKLLDRWNPGIRAKADAGSIDIYDVLGGYYGGVTAKDVAAKLRAIGDQQVVVNINSPGGDVFEGIAIYNLLRDHPYKVTTRVLGSALSAASIVMMAGDRIEVGRAAFVMIHNVWMIAMGNRNDLRAAADTLEPVDAALAAVYAARTGLGAADIAAMMDKETWMGGSEAVAQGFADDLLAADQVEETDEDVVGAAAAMRRVDAALKAQGVPRAERRALLKQLAGMPGAANHAKPGAGEQGVDTEFFRSIAARHTPIQLLP